MLPATAISAAQGLGGSRSSEREEKFLAERQRPGRAAKKFSQEPLDREGGPDKLGAVAQLVETAEGGPNRAQRERLLEARERLG